MNCSGATRVRLLSVGFVVLALLMLYGPGAVLAAEECNDGTNTLTLPEDPVPSSNPYTGQ